MAFQDPDKTFDQLDVEAALEILTENGPFSRTLKNFEAREEQKQMMRNVLDAYNRNQVALIEAGTGTGKSLAYLIPAMLWAIQTKERTVISTNTIPLQEQLLEKDIPLIEKSLNLDVKAVLVKGMHNYICLRKFFDTQQELLLHTEQEAQELEKIDQWQRTTNDGSRSSLSFSPSPAVWEKISAESDTCNRNACPYYQQCHFFKARRQASEAQLLIVNHHLLFADLVCRTENEGNKDAGILPSYNRIILDEAHNIEDIATEYFASRLSQIEIIRLLARISSEKAGKAHGKLHLIKEKLHSIYRNDLNPALTSLHNRLNIDLPGMRRDFLQQVHDTFGAFFDFVQMMSSHRSDESPHKENKLRILPHHQSHNYWKEKLVPRAEHFSECIKKYAQALSALIEDIKYLKNQQLDEQIKGTTFEIEALINRLKSQAAMVDQFITEVPTEKKVRWIELQAFKSMVNTSLVDADLDISKTLAESLFSKFSTVILCSATLTTNKNFHFIKNRLGLIPEYLKRSVKEYTYSSPFNFAQQALFAIPIDLPNPTDGSFTQAATERIWQAIQSSQGNAFVLFTSYNMLKTCYDFLEKRLRELRYHPLKQGDEERQILINKFKATDRSVLFGTDSFWEGIDVAGEALRCVIIVKLPFRTPNEPLIQARSEAITAKGGDPFMEYSLPQAIVKFKQGFGRLIRNKRDRGCIVCLDNRIMTKRYGQLFLSSLPDCQKAFVPSDNLHQQMSDFYKRTHFLTN